jgi:ketosteroid isomerase-like protein
MSSANLDLVRSIYAAWERGDYSRTSWADPEIEIVSISELFPGSATGVGELARFWREIISPLEDFCVEAKDFRELDEERILVLAEWSGRGKASGIAIKRTGAHVFHMRHSRVLKLALYEDRIRALADLGVTPDTGT